MELAAAMDAARAHGFNDRQPPRHRIDWDDPLERVAIMLHAFRGMTPDEAAGNVSAPAGQATLAIAWRRMEAADRQLWRRRAWLALDNALRGHASTVDDATSRKDWG